MDRKVIVVKRDWIIHWFCGGKFIFYQHFNAYSSFLPNDERKSITEIRSIFLYALIFVREIGYINLVQSRSVVRSSICTYVCPSGFVMFLVIVSSPKPLVVATSNLQVYRSHDIDRTRICFL